MSRSASNDVAGDETPKAGNPDPTMKKPAGEPSGENVPPKGGESMAPADSKHPYAPPGGVKHENEA